MAESLPSKPCKRCTSHDAPYTLRNDPTCRSCYVNYVDLKMAKRLGALHRDVRPSKGLTIRRYVAGLSFGPSSSTLVNILDATVQRLAAKKGASAFEPLVIHVDTDLANPGAAQDLLRRYQERYPAVAFECVHLSEVLSVRSVDWSALPLGDGDDVARLKGLFERLPTVTARADILRLLVRHLLLHIAMEKGYSALLLGHNTTSLAALTLSEVANGRGFAVPWQINDGLTTVCTYEQGTTESGTPSTKETGRTEFPVYYPLREVFRNEIVQFTELVSSLEGLIVFDDRGTRSVVSHKDLSIEEVMKRYFEGVEENFAGIVSNVVRTTGKLERLAGDGFCGSCGMTLDEQGDSRWAGELGDDPGDASAGSGKLCYGCKRSIHG